MLFNSIKSRIEAERPENERIGWFAQFSLLTLEPRRRRIRNRRHIPCRYGRYTGVREAKPQYIFPRTGSEAGPARRGRKKIEPVYTPPAPEVPGPVQEMLRQLHIRKNRSGRRRRWSTAPRPGKPKPRSLKPREIFTRLPVPREECRRMDTWFERKYPARHWWRWAWSTCRSRAATRRSRPICWSVPTVS